MTAAWKVIKTGEEPLVSVCIPTYNRACKLERSVIKLLEGDYRNIEVIISDNSSTDETPAVSDSLQKLDKRVRVYRHPYNRGLTANFAFARSQAMGEYFLWHADDDYLPRHYIAECVDVLESSPELVLAYGLAAFHSGDDKITGYGRPMDLPSALPEVRILKYLWQVREDCIFCGVYRVSPLRDCDMPNILAGDWAWISEVVSSGPVRRIPGLLVYRERGSSASSSPEGSRHLIDAMGLPAWQASWPTIATAHGIATYFLLRSKHFAKQSWPRRASLAAVVCVLLIVKGRLPELIGLAHRIPGAKSLYLKYRKRKTAS